MVLTREVEVQAVAHLEGCHQGLELPARRALWTSCHQRCSAIRGAGQAAHRPDRRGQHGGGWGCPAGPGFPLSAADARRWRRGG
jgi:hypothetical protein